MSPGENVTRIALGVLKAVNDKIVEKDIQGVRRLKGKITNNNPILVKLKYKESRDMIFGNRRRLGGVNFKEIGINAKKVFINENLTSDSKELFYHANNFRKSNNWKFAWTANGNIFLKKHEESKAYLVKQLQDLDKLSK